MEAQLRCRWFEGGVKVVQLNSKNIVQEQPLSCVSVENHLVYLFMRSYSSNIWLCSLDTPVLVWLMINQ